MTDIKLQERPFTVEVGPQAPPAPSQPQRLRVRAPGKWMVVAAVCGVAVIALTATLAVALPGKSAPTKEATRTIRAAEDPHMSAPAPPLQSLPALGQIMEAIKEQQEDSQPAEPEFVETDVDLESLIAHDSKSPKPQQKTPVAHNAKKDQKKKAVRESTRLQSSRLPDGSLVCETPECAVAANSIVEALDLSVNPCDNFYQFACGGWINKHPIPENGATGTFYEAGDLLDKRLHLILETAAPPDAPAPLQMTRSFYHSCMDTDTMDSLGLSPLLTSLELQGGWPMITDNWDPSRFDLIQAINNLRSINLYPMIASGVDLDIEDTSTRILYIEASTIILGPTPSEAYLSRYRTFMIDSAKLLRQELGSSISDEEIASQVEEVINFEIAYAQMVYATADQVTNELWRTDIKGLQAATDGGTSGAFDWLAFVKDMFTKTDVEITEDEPIISAEGPFFANFSSFIHNTDPRILANAIGWVWLYDIGQETTYAMRNITYTFFYGGNEPPLRYTHCVAQTNIDLGFAVSRDYVDEFMPSTVKTEATELVEDIRTSFNALLDENEWMLQADLEVAREKLQAIDPFVAYPDWIMNDTELVLGYEGLKIVDGEEYDNLVRLGSWLNQNALSLLREVPEHSYLFPPTVVNAFYNPQENTITILGGILQAPFYAHNSLAALNYGGIGMVIGHEMTHGFDNTGRLFDKDGNLVQWWSDETVAAYEKRAQCFIDQYNDFIPPELIDVGLNASVNGVQTEGENIADNGGIREAYRAYQLYVDRYGEEPRLPGLDEFTPDHLFYLGFAYVWCEHKSAESILGQLAFDPHSPGRFRVLGSLSNDEEFSRVWNCPVESEMNRGDERCLLW